MAGEIGITALAKAFDLTMKYLEKAGDKNRKITDRCEDYLHAVQAAIIGLESEYDEILTQAELCDLNHPKQVHKLRTRITDYLTVHKLHTTFGIAMQGLADCETELRKGTESKFQFLWKEKREAALAMFNYLLERLTEYLQILGDPHGMTGVGMQWLRPIKQLLDNLDPQQKDNQSKLTSLVTQARADRDKDNLMYLTREAERITNILLLAFS
jgi:hypothetical protein